MLLETTGAAFAVVGAKPVVRAGIGSLISEAFPGPLLEADSVADLAAQLRGAPGEGPKVILLEWSSWPTSPADAVRQARRAFPAARAVLMTDCLTLESIADCYAAGLDGYLMADIGPGSLARSLSLVLAGEKVFPSRLAVLMTDCLRQFAAGSLPSLASRSCALSERELEILHCLRAGDSNKEIARRLEITEATVKAHMKSVMKKTKAKNRTQAAMWAINGLAAMAPAAAE